MSNETHLWDDSALLNALNDAIYKYNVMHSTAQQTGRSNDGEKILTNSNVQQSDRSKEEEETNVKKQVDRKEQFGQPKEGEKMIVTGDNSGDVEDFSGKGVLSSLTDGEEANDPLSSQENPHTDSYAPELHKDTSSDPHMQETLKGYANFGGVDDYNQLLNQYYELEEQRQKVLLKLQQVGYWNKQYSGEDSGPGLQCGTYSTQEYQNPNNQIVRPVVTSACCPYVCHGVAIPCSVMPACPLGEACANKACADASPVVCTMGSGKLSSFNEDTLTKTAMEAAENALSSMKLNASSTSNTHEVSSQEGRVAESINTETDLTVVFKAWYSAGFHTGKYLSEQSIAKRRHE